MMIVYKTINDILSELNINKSSVYNFVYRVNIGSNTLKKMENNNEKNFIILICIFLIMIILNIIKIVDINTASTVRKSYLLAYEKNVKLWEREFDCTARYVKLSFFKRIFTSLELSDYEISRCNTKMVSLDISDINDEYAFHVENIIEEDNNTVSIRYYSGNNIFDFDYTIGDKEIDPELENFLSKKGFPNFTTYLKQIEENRKDFDEKLEILTKIKTKIYLIYIAFNLFLLTLCVGSNVFVNHYLKNNIIELESDNEE